MKRLLTLLVLIVCGLWFFGCSTSEPDTVDANNNPFTEFCGTYSDLKTWRDTGILLEITLKDNILNINYTYHYHWEHLYDQEISFNESADISNVTSPVVEFTFTDNYGNKATMVLEFDNSNGNKQVNCIIKDILTSDEFNGISEIETLLSYTPDIKKHLVFAEDDLTEWEALGYPEYDIATGNYKLPDQSKNRYASNDLGYFEDNTITVNPKNIYWMDDVLVAEVFIINSFPYDVHSLEFTQLIFSNLSATFASCYTGVISDIYIEAESYITWSFNLSDDAVLLWGADLKNGVYIQSSTNYRYQEKPSYDTSKASGILASLGMTEEEFRASCQELDPRYYSNQNDLTYADLLEYPSNYVNKHFVITGENYGYPYYFNCDYKFTSTDGYPYYIDISYHNVCDAEIYDFRDNTQSPNIVQDDTIIAYVIFKEVRNRNGDDYLVFWLISMDKED